MREIYQPYIQIVAEVGIELGVTVATSNVAGSTDRDASQLAKFVVEACEELLTRFPWRTTLGTNPWVKYADGTFGFYLSADTDVPLFDARLLKLGTKWRYLHAKGLAYDEIFRAYEARINALAFNQNRNDVVDTNDPSPSAI